MLVRKNDQKGNQLCASNYYCKNEAHTTLFQLADVIKYIIPPKKITGAKHTKKQLCYPPNDLPREDYTHRRRAVITFIFAAKTDNDEVLSLIFFHTYQRYCGDGMSKLKRGMWVARCQADRHSCLRFSFLKLLVTSLVEIFLHSVYGLLRAHRQ